jgi:hypothetical protein
VTARGEVTVQDRLRRALLAFQTAQGHLLAAYRKLKGLPGTRAQGVLGRTWPADCEGPERRRGEGGSRVHPARRHPPPTTRLRCKGCSRQMSQSPAPLGAFKA